VAIQEKLNNFKRNKVWSLVERTKLSIVGTNGYSITSKIVREPP
jgi:hypothetical protein